ncbi:hypothetical protein [Gilvimarinus xylanilyticus]|uniref:Uncharacterized protein n=1 Tax=Gilvimarinus xylanilyticus TaxID=2944139 RepID=A0A9X2KV33_9GAMM|nr:hypothetical protein [Gilvimarinus xylanilyticus]MCP8901004.1 hypothetical protein [Gilvimarinus xylanilyticus]
MFRFLAKSAVATVIWKRYNRVIISTLTLLISYFLIAALHSDYTDYARSTGVTGFLWLSYFAKWGGYVLVTSLYYWYLKYALRPKPKKRDDAFAQTRSQPNKKRAQPQQPSEPSADPFADIRRKDRLKNRADFAMQDHRSQPKD